MIEKKTKGSRNTGERVGQLHDVDECKKRVERKVEAVQNELGGHINALRHNIAMLKIDVKKAEIEVMRRDEEIRFLKQSVDYFKRREDMAMSEVSKQQEKIEALTARLPDLRG